MLKIIYLSYIERGYKIIIIKIQVTANFYFTYAWIFIKKE